MSEVALAAKGSPLRVVDTMAKLRTLDTSDVEKSAPVLLDGFAAPDDGGGGLFVWRETSKDADNGGTVVRPDGVKRNEPGRWVRPSSGVINVRWFGAGLGHADDSPRIQQAVETAIHTGAPDATAFGSTVYFPAGNYHLAQPVHLETSDSAYAGWVSVRVTGDGKFNTHLKLTGPSSTAFVLGGLSQAERPEGAGWRLRHCEISNLSIEQVGDTQRHDGAIHFPGGGIGFLIQNAAMYGVWRGFTCSGTGESITWRAKIQNVHLEGVLNAGLYARHAINWDVSNLYVGCRDYSPEPPPDGTAGIWLDTRTEGWMFSIVEVGGFDTCLRMVNGSPGERPPDTHQFVQCNFDAAGRACIWLTNSHRCRFQGCYASSENPTLTAVVVLDSPDVYGFEWADSVVLNAYNYGFWISDATHFSIVDSTFATWGKTKARGTYEAITVAGAASEADAHLSFMITGNTFFNDPDFPAHSANELKPVRVQGAPRQYFRKYIVSNNISYGEKIIPSTDGGTAASGQKVFTNNL